MNSDGMNDTKNVYIIGNGSIGSFLALLIAKIAQTFSWNIVLIDFDSVEPHNTLNQIYGTEFEGRKKSEALRQILERHVSDVHIRAKTQAANEKTTFQGIVIVAVDNMTARREIFHACKFNAAVPLFIEARSGGTYAIVHAFDPRDPDNVDRYKQTLHDDEDGIPAPCADATTTPILYILGAIIAKLLVRYETCLIHKDEFLQIPVNMDGHDDLPTIGYMQYTGISI